MNSGRSGTEFREGDGSVTAELKTVAAMLVLLAGLLGSLAAEAGGALRGTGDLAIVIQRADGSVQILDPTTNQSIGKSGGLGDLSHASAVYSRDAGCGSPGNQNGLWGSEMLTLR